MAGAGAGGLDQGKKQGKDPTKGQVQWNMLYEHHNLQ